MYLEFYISVGDQAVNASDVVETFKVPNLNLLTAELKVQVEFTLDSAVIICSMVLSLPPSTLRENVMFYLAF